MEEIKRGIASLSPKEQNEVSAFLLCLRLAADLDYQEIIASRSVDRDPTHRLTTEVFERRLG